MASFRQFGRVVRLSIVSSTGDVIAIDGFDIAFDIEKNKEPEPNKGKIDIYNLAQVDRNKLQLDSKSEVTLEAGYKQSIATIFQGTVMHVYSRLVGPDWVTTIEAGEGLKPYRTAYAAKSFGEGTPFKTVIEYVVQTFEGFKVTPAITATISSIGKSFPNGLTLDGPSAKILNDILRGTGLAFSIQNGKMEILKNGEPSTDPAISLDYSSGLVGTPQMGEKKEGEKPKQTITFQCFVRPDIVPNRRVVLKEPKELQGTYVPETVKIKGSNFDNEFYCTVEAFIP